MADMIRSAAFVGTLRENVARYFGIPVERQAIYDEDGLLTTGADFSRAIQRVSPKLFVYDIYEIGPELREGTIEDLKALDAYVEKSWEHFGVKYTRLHQTAADCPSSCANNIESCATNGAEFNEVKNSDRGGGKGHGSASESTGAEGGSGGTPGRSTTPPSSAAVTKRWEILESGFGLAKDEEKPTTPQSSSFGMQVTRWGSGAPNGVVNSVTQPESGSHKTAELPSMGTSLASAAQCGVVSPAPRVIPPYRRAGSFPVTTAATITTPSTPATAIPTSSLPYRPHVGWVVGSSVAPMTVPPSFSNQTVLMRSPSPSPSQMFGRIRLANTDANSANLVVRPSSLGSRRSLRGSAGTPRRARTPGPCRRVVGEPTLSTMPVTLPSEPTTSQPLVMVRRGSPVGRRAPLVSRNLAETRPSLSQWCNPVGPHVVMMGGPSAAPTTMGV